MSHTVGKSILLLLGVVMVTFTLAACGGGNDDARGTGKAVFAVSDDTVDIESVSSIEMTINSVQVHSAGGAWTTVSSETKTFDLLELNAKGTMELLAQADLQAGTYDQMRLDVSKVIVVDASGQHEAKLPSNMLQFKGTLDVNADSTATANFDFQADESLHITGEGRFIFSPVIQLETRADANAQVQANNEVKISGGKVTIDASVGMNAEGSMDVGLRISPDAVLSIAASGKVVQAKGQAFVSGTIKSVDSANGTVTLTTKGGTELILHMTSEASIKVNGSLSTLTSLSSRVGSETVAQYNAETKALSKLAAGADVKAKADVGAMVDISGTVKSVNAAEGTVTVTTDSGADVILKVASDSQLLLGGTLSTLLGLQAKIGSKIDAQYNATTGTVAELDAQAEASVTASGTVKAVNPAEGTVTIATQSGADLVLKAAFDTNLVINGTLGTLASLKSMIGSEATVTYNQTSKVAADLSVQGKAESSAAVTGVIKAVNPAQGTVTITASSGQEIVLNVTAASSIVAEGTIATLVDLAGKVGAQATASYNSQTKAATTISAQSQISTSATVAGTIKSVNILQGTVTITKQAGGELVLKVTGDTRLLLGGVVTTMANLAANIGAQVTAEYNAQTNTATSIRAQGSTGISTTVSGTLKSVDAVQGTVTVATQAGGELVLKVTGETNVTASGAATTLANLAANIGAQVSAEYNAQTNTATSLSANAQGSASASTTASGTLKAANTLTNTVTVAIQGKADLVLQLTAQSKIVINGTSSSIIALAAKAGSQISVSYDVQTQSIIVINVQ